MQTVHHWHYYKDFTNKKNTAVEIKLKYFQNAIFLEELFGVVSHIKLNELLDFILQPRNSKM